MFSIDINANECQFLKPTRDLTMSSGYCGFWSGLISEGFKFYLFFFFGGGMSCDQFCFRLSKLWFFLARQPSFSWWRDILKKQTQKLDLVARLSVDYRPTQTSSLRPFDNRATTDRFALLNITLTLLVFVFIFL